MEYLAEIMAICPSALQAQLGHCCLQHLAKQLGLFLIECEHHTGRRCIACSTVQSHAYRASSRSTPHPSPDREGGPITHGSGTATDGDRVAAGHRRPGYFFDARLPGK